MLTALMLMGMRLLAALPFLIEPDSDPTGHETPATQAPEVGENPNGPSISTLDVTDATIDPAKPEPDSTRAYSVPAVPGTTVFSDFRPGTDIVDLDLSFLDEPVTCAISTDALGATISFLIDSQGPTILEFWGLAEAPTQDVILKLADDRIGLTFDISLVDAMASNDVLIRSDVSPRHADLFSPGPAPHQSA